MIGFQIVSGAERKAFDSVCAIQDQLLREGRASIWIPLNGGSEARQEQIEHWQQFAKDRNIGFVNQANCALIVGGRG